MLERIDGKYILDSKPVSEEDLLDEVMALDDRLGGAITLSEEENGRLQTLFSQYDGVPDFTEVLLMKASSSLFSYLADSGDSHLASLVASRMGWVTHEERLEEIRKSSQESSSYRAWWRALAQEVLTGEGFDDYRFGSVRQDRNGTYLYDGERAVCYIEVSRQGGEKRSALISLTLLGNPEAIEDEEGNRAFEWCCFFDDELGARGDGATILGGQLRAIDPFGPNSTIQRRYDIVYREIDATTLGLVVKSLVRMLESYPPETLE